MSKILIIDDDHGFCKMLAEGVRRLGHEPACAYNLTDGVSMAHQGRYEVVYLDVGLPDGNGLDRINDIKGCPSSPEVIIATGQGGAHGAELAMKVGAWDYLEKPSPLKAMTLPLVRALQYREAKGTRRDPSHIERHGIVGNSRGLLSCLELLSQAAGSNASVLISGETGTGKELFARAIHANSPRAGGELVVVDCTALPETLVGSLLFGHERGSFTGATRAHEGLIRKAHLGTLFMDEVGELPLKLQKAFLRVLQERRFRPVGSGREEKSDFRLVVATNRNLEQMVEQGHFRQDLLYRLRSLTIELPPLRERAEDIPHLALYYMTKMAADSGQPTKGLSPEFFSALTVHQWPGNVRELFNTLERAVAAAGQEPVLHPMHLPTEIRVRLARQSLGGSPAKPAPEPGAGATAPPPAAAMPPDPIFDPPLEEDGPLPTWKEYKEIALAQVGRRYLQKVMDLCNGEVNQAQEITGLSRARLYALMKSFSLPRRRWVRRQ